MDTRIITYLFLAAILSLSTSCIEEVEFQNESFESALVIEATITNEMKQQEVLLSRTYMFEDEGPSPEIGASVEIRSSGNIMSFEETEAGRYVSVEEFSAEHNRDYQLSIRTANGRVYSSTPVQLTSETAIDELYAVREVNDDGVDGMFIYVDSFNPAGTSRFYRYEFEESFKIIAPEWVEWDAIVLSDIYPFCEVGLVKRPEEQRICYRTENSNTINVTSTEAFSEDRLTRYPVHFLSNQNYRISHRYSILVKQYVQSKEAYEYLNTISGFTEENSVFSQIQSGYVNGNIVSESNSAEKVVGIFEVSSVDSKRIFFNYEDFYPNSILPPYVIGCQFLAPRHFAPAHQEKCGPLMNIIRIRSMVYLKDNEGEIPHPFGGPYLMVPRACGDCTAIGSIEPPEFWIE